jgi:hypothetical protein
MVLHTFPMKCTYNHLLAYAQEREENLHERKQAPTASQTSILTKIQLAISMSYLCFPSLSFPLPLVRACGYVCVWGEGGVGERARGRAASCVRLSA